MQEIVFKLALAVIISAAVFFLLAETFSQLSNSSAAVSGNIETARIASLNKTAGYLQQ